MAPPRASLRQILCPTDFSGFARHAYAAAVRLARGFDSHVTLLHVLPPDIPVAGELIYATPPRAVLEVRRAARRAELSAFAAAVPHAGVRVDAILREGDVVHEIRRVVLERQADLIVMGTRGRTGLGRLMFGSVTEALVRHAPVPVLTVHRPVPPKDGIFRRVLCAVDVSEWTAGTVGCSTALLSGLARQITVLSVIEDPTETPELTRAELTAHLPDETLAGCDIDVRIGFGKPAEEILAVAQEESSDLIVLGSHGRGAVERLVFGSTVRDVIRFARCPVMIVPAGYVWRKAAVKELVTA